MQFTPPRSREPGESEFSHGPGLDAPYTFADYSQKLGVRVRVRPADEIVPPSQGGRYRGTTPPVDPQARDAHT